MRIHRLILVTLLTASMAPGAGEAEQMLQRALYLGDRYNWSEAADLFAQAETAFRTAGDARNELHARLGRIRGTVQRDGRALPEVAAQLGDDIASNPILRKNKTLRMFAWIVKGDIDGETNASAMRRDWQEVAALARELGDAKWQYRALAQLGVAAFFDRDLETARKNVAAALQAAQQAGDVPSQVRFLYMLAAGLLQSKMYQQALPLTENALALAATAPDMGYQFTVREIRLPALIGAGRFADAKQLGDEIIGQARAKGLRSHEAAALVPLAHMYFAQSNPAEALAATTKAIEIAGEQGFFRIAADAHALASSIHLAQSRSYEAAFHADAAARSTQEAGDLWAVPARLQTLAELLIARGKYAEADQEFDRAEAFVDSALAGSTTALEKAAVIKASSEIYAKHLALVAERFNDPARAYSIVEQVRGRTVADLLVTGAQDSPEAKEVESRISRLRLKLMRTRATADVKRLRQEIFLAEQARWAASGANSLKMAGREPVSADKVMAALPAGALLLEFVLDEPKSYALVISKQQMRLARLAGKGELDRLIAAFSRRLRAGDSSVSEAKALCAALFGSVPELGAARSVVIVRDGALHSVPFDALIDGRGRALALSTTVSYAPSATAYFLLAQGRPEAPGKRMLAVGGVGDLPSSSDEVRIVARAIPQLRGQSLLGAAATESAFKKAELGSYRILHFATHATADKVNSDRAAVILAADAAAGEDGQLQAAEVVQLRFRADLVVLSACDTSVGTVQGQEGIANLSRAFLLAGARNVVSTLWPVEDEATLLLMRRFYGHLAGGTAVADALTAAKRDVIRQFGARATPNLWAGFIIEGAATNGVVK